MRLPSSFSDVALRIASQGLRLVLSFYVVGFLGLRAAGNYGLALGAVAIVPALIGWGLNYHVAREISGLTPREASPLVLGRIVISLASLAALSVVAAPIIAIAAPRNDWTFYVLLLALLWLETIALDLFVALVSLGKSLLANFLVFVRSALWAVPVMVLGLIDPRFRTLDLLLATWIGFHLAALAILAAKLVAWKAMPGRAECLEIGWARRWVKRHWFIYLSDLGYVGLMYLDRYLVLIVLGLTATAIYTFYWALANALQTIVLAGLVQAGRPRLIVTANRGDMQTWRAEVRSQLNGALGLAIALGAVNFVITEAVIRWAPPGTLPTDRLLFGALLIATVLRCGSDVLNSALISVRRDRAFAAANLLGIPLTLIAVAAAMTAWGLPGAGLASLAVAATLFAMRAVLLSCGNCDPRTPGAGEQTER